MYFKSKQVSRDLFSSNQRNGSDMAFLSWATKFKHKSLKAWKDQLCSDGRFEPLTNSGRNFTWVY